MVAVSPFEIIAGPASVWVAPVGSTFPALNALASAIVSPWISLGKTDGGVKVKVSQSVQRLRVDQLTGPVKAIRTEEDLSVSFALAELTIEILAAALSNATNAMTTTTGASGVIANKMLKLYRGPVVDRWAMLVRGPSPYMDGYAQWEIPIITNQSEFEIGYSREDKATVATEWFALEDSSVQDEGSKFGVLRARTA